MNRELLEAIRLASPIEAVATENVNLRRCGLELSGLCPFHSEKTPSFSINPGKGFFYCHGCQAGGDVFAFVMRLYDSTFTEAAKRLAVRAGIAWDGFKPSPELSAKVNAINAQREEEKEFQRFRNQRIDAINAQYRAHCRAATFAENYLIASGENPDPDIEEVAWAALERYRAFEVLVEREELCGLRVLSEEWEKQRAA